MKRESPTSKRSESGRSSNCGKKIPEQEAKEIEEAGVEPYCSLYCAYIDSGVPLSYSKGIMNE